MVSAPLSEQDTFIIQFDAASPVSLGALAKHGLSCIERGLYAEGAVFFALASERLPSTHVQLSSTLDRLRSAVAGFLQAQEALLEASKQLAASDAEQQTQIASLKRLLPLLIEMEASVKTLPLRLVRREKQTDDHEGPEIETEKIATPSSDPQTLPDLHMTCFGLFEVRRGAGSTVPLDLCSNVKGQAILRYLITQPQHRASVDKLLAALWPDDEPEAAQHKLRVAISALRVSLNRNVVNKPGGGYILCKSQVYFLNPAVKLHTDVDEFLALYRAGQATSGHEAMTLYERACQLYSGPYLSEDLYTEWSYMTREELMKAYVTMCDSLAEFALSSGSYQTAIKWASAILKVDRCDEQAHRQLMRAYAALKRRNEALRQYQLCQQILTVELGVQPMLETQRLLQALLQG